MKLKAVVSDMDGTLLRTDHELSEFTKNTLKRIIDKNIKLFIATGRHYMDLKKYAKQLSNDLYLISSNGAAVHSGKGELLYSKFLDNDLIKEILELVPDSLNVHINFYDIDNWLAFERNAELEVYTKKNNFLAKIIKTEDLKDYKILKIFFMSNDYEGMNKFEKILEEKFKGKISVFFSTPEFLEIVSFGATKGNAMEKVLEKEKLKLENTIAFGDGMNDLDMLSKAGKGLIMGNAHERLKNELNNLEVIGTCDEDSVAKYLEKFI